jgi:hypothetical protein
MKIRRVFGSSMEPALLPGDIIIARKPGKLKTGDIIMADIDDREVIKRITELKGDTVHLEGDNKSASTDSRSYGAVPRSAIVGIVMARLRLATATPAPKVKNKKLLTVPYALAAFIFVVLTTLLLRIHNFVGELNLLVEHELTAKLTAAFSAILLLASLPFLLRLNLSPLMRAISALSLLAAPAVSMLVTPFLFARVDSGYAFGANMDAASIASTLVFAALFVIALWSFYILGGQHVFNRLKSKR